MKGKQNKRVADRHVFGTAGSISTFTCRLRQGGFFHERRRKVKDSFAGFHPVINFIYFTAVIGFAMFFTHPACLLISLACAFAYSIYLKGRRALRFNLLVMLPMLAVTALLNPAFNHQGVTILTYLPSGNPLTLESIAYGGAAGAMFITVICWFSCYNEVMTSDKFVYLFGRVIPALSLVLSMTLRFVPKFKAQLKVVSTAQKCVGRDASTGGVIRRARNGIRILSIMITWSLENAIETADSMKSRGYGLPGRTAFSIFRFDRRDKLALTALLGCVFYILLGAWLGGIKWRYYPSIKGRLTGPLYLSVLAVYLLLCALPLLINDWEDRKWKRLISEA